MVFVVLAGYVGTRLVNSQQTESGQPSPRQGQNGQLSPEEKWKIQEIVNEMIKPTWQVRSDDRDPIDDTPRLAYALRADAQDPKKWPSEDGPALVLRCFNRKTEVFIVSGVFEKTEVPRALLPSPESHFTTSVRVRLDDSPATEEEWTLGPHAAWFSPAPIKLIDQLVSTRLLQFEYGTLEGKAIIRFNINHLATEKRDRLAKACNWSSQR